MSSFEGFHSEWNLGSPGGWDYQRTTQEIAKVVWYEINRRQPTGVELDFDHPMFYPVVGFTEMLLQVYRRRDGTNAGLIAVVAEEDTLTTVTENINLARRLDAVEGITGILAAPHEFELRNGRVCHQGRPVSLVFMDFNNDVFLKLHRRHDLSPLIQAIRENRVLNPRGTEPINVKSMFEVITGPRSERFHSETVARTPWTRRFVERRTTGPQGEPIDDLIAWTRANWLHLVLKPERGYSGIGVKVGGVDPSGDDAVATALAQGGYIVQEKVALGLWGEVMPEIDHDQGRIVLVDRQTDFRCLIGPGQVFGFLCRFGDVPTNVGSGGGVQPLAILKSDLSVREAVDRINRTIASIGMADLLEIEKNRTIWPWNRNSPIFWAPSKSPCARASSPPNNWRTCSATAPPCGPTASNWNRCGLTVNWTNSSASKTKNWKSPDCSPGRGDRPSLPPTDFSASALTWRNHDHSRGPGLVEDAFRRGLPGHRRPHREQ